MDIKKKLVLVLIVSLTMGFIILLVINNQYIKTSIVHDEVLVKYNKEKENLERFLEKVKVETGINVDSYESFEKIRNQFSIEVESLSDEKKKNDARKESLIEQRNVLIDQYNKLLEEERKRKNYQIENIETLNQYALGFPNGCESVALTILLHYYNIDVSSKEIVDRLKKGDLPHFEGGIRYGGNPYLEFIGNPANSNSYGVYDDPIIEVANYYKDGIVKAQGISLDEVLAIVKENKPVIVWTSNNMAIPYINQSWTYKPTGETIYWMKNLHAVVIIGRADDQIIVSDPINGKIRYFDKDIFESRYNSFGKRALYY